MPFSNPILGGDFLIRPAMISPNYIPGVSGWIIRKDGSAEFNNLNARGSVTVGPDPGAHIIVDAVTDTILVYNASNQLVASVSPKTQTIAGVSVPLGITSYDAAHPENRIRMVGSQLELFDHLAAPDSSFSLISPNNFASDGQRSGMALLSGAISGGPQAAIQILSQSGDATQPAVLLGNQRGVQGGLVQVDNGYNGTLRRTFTGSGTTDGTGKLVIATGAGFAATGGTVMYDQTGRGSGPFCSALYFDVTSGSIGTQWMSGTATLNSTTVYYRGEIWG